MELFRGLPGARSALRDQGGPRACGECRGVAVCTRHEELRAPYERAGCSSGIVVNGYSNLVSGVKSEARRTIEAKYADEWNVAGLIRRWKLQRMMNAEIEELAAKLMPEVSPDAMF